MEDITDIVQQPITGFIQLIGEARQPHFLTDSFNCWNSSQIMLHYLSLKITTISWNICQVSQGRGGYEGFSLKTGGYSI